jgi:beta-lactam-binding protein with PASTA domain
VVVLVSMLVSAATVVAVHLVLDVMGGGGQVEAPPLVGMSVDQARLTAKSAGLDIQVTGKVADPVVEEGFIARQIPLAGVRLDKGTRVAVVVSGGSNRLQVPSLQNIRLAEALQQLKKAGLKWGETRFAHHETVAPGNVISTDPAAGSMVAPGTMVNLLVSRKSAAPAAAPTPKQAAAPAPPPLPAAPPPAPRPAPRRPVARDGEVLVPKVQGVRLQFARSRLQRKGLTVGRISYGSDEDHMEEMVLGQTPAPGSSVPRGSPVDLVVNRIE